MLATVAPSPVQALPVPMAMWEAQAGDHFVVDTKANMGYMVHENGDFVSFEVATGQRRTVHYIGRTYNAATPAQEWTAESLETKGDHVTFGPTGKFFRLFDDSDGTRTAYGIHTYKYEDYMFDGARYGSMGCIIVRQTDLPLIEKTFDVNDNKLSVTTVYGFDALIAQAKQL